MSYETTVQWYTKFSKFCYTTIISHFEHILPCHHMVVKISVVLSVFVQLNCCDNLFAQPILSVIHDHSEGYMSYV